MKYLPEGSDFKTHVNLIITELPKKLLGYAGLPGKVSLGEGGSGGEI